MSRPAPSRKLPSRSTFLVSWPDSMRPSLTHWLRIRSRRRSVASAVGSAAALVGTPPTLGRSGSGSDRVDQLAVFTMALGASLEDEVLEVGECLALGHHAPVLPWKQLV